jgi:hypothetical protein
LKRYDSKEARARFNVPDKCLECKHFARVVPKFKGGWCRMADDGYTNDCLLD